MSYRNLNPIIKKFIFVVFLYGLTSASFNGFFGIYVKELGYSESIVGTILSLRRFSVGIMAFVIAILAEKIDHKKTLLLGLITVGLSSIFIVLVENVNLMKVMAVVFGFGQAAMMTVESPFIYNQTDIEERVHAFSLTFATRNAAFMTGSLLTGFLADYFSEKVGAGAISIRYALIVISIISLIAIFPLSRLKPKPVVVTKKLNLREFNGFFTKVNVLFLSYTGFIGLGAGLVVPFFGVYLKYMLDTTDSIVGLILSFAQLGTVFGGLSVPFLSRRIGNYKTIVATQLLSIPLLIAIGLPQGIVIVAIAFFLRSSLMNMGQPLIRNISMHIVDDHHRPLMSAMRAMLNNLSRALGIFLGGRIMGIFTYNTPYIFTILFYLIGTSIFFTIFKKEILKNKSIYQESQAK
ncbi:MFS transporter [Alkaliphilus serpentinus]|uniref:MFS transporter n=1 Tax=Alkaliphilus serpentinus TaxID=1482731 RepID=A0A833HLQ8_9FIRM|nr:MFS transporter [Alkaliphilus serpentinus]KAB3526244.1 MFS transporter [Alkaliphilus serpentinus]